MRLAFGIGADKPEKRVAIALENSLFIICIYEGDQIIGMGRIVGDGGVTYAITDIMVDKKYQNRGIGTQIMTKIDAWLQKHTDESSYVMLLANVPANHLYERFSFEAAPEIRLGMLRKQKKKQ